MLDTTINRKSVVITFDAHDKRATGFFEWLKMLDFLKIEESPYNQQYVAEVKEMREKEFQPIKAAEIWK